MTFFQISLITKYVQQKQEKTYKVSELYPAIISKDVFEPSKIEIAQEYS